MKTRILLIALLAISTLANGQKLIAKTGHIWFYSYTPMEVIEAHNRQVVSILDLSNGDFLINLLNKSFEFKVALMQEHFNENYMESDKFPKADFKGTITNNSAVNYSKDGVYQVDVKGDLTIHGVTKSVTTKGTVEIKGGSVTGKAKFTVSPKDYDIKIPSLVESKIAKDIEINVDITYTPYKP